MPPGIVTTSGNRRAKGVAFPAFLYVRGWHLCFTMNHASTEMAPHARADCGFQHRQSDSVSDSESFGFRGAKDPRLAGCGIGLAHLDLVPRFVARGPWRVYRGR